ncbi:alkaline phosphatase [Paremcibacter congregatus]|uniref:Alkaline phosphatase n=1 Tax=Paremcibacter congregatus TaxID=2043170 RepID=A0A2G4YW93_9PROT|nr:alkaline phosphatase [Paremcibacter congregatus]PHZ86533.1 alkaline phosphatase [Paremcibacter congregatus]QDE26336.1 alkaline phosphatase [Paremcibacter congregatus]
MKLKLLSSSTLICASLLLVSCFDQTESTPAAAKADRPKNVILFVGDGMGISTVTAIRILDGQLKGGQGEDNVLSWETFPHVALSKTYNTNQQVPDSAGTATAFMTGVKTKAGFINVGPGSRRGECIPAEEHFVLSALEKAEQKGLATGVVTTARLTHATPATTYAHVSERDWETDSDMPDQARKLGCRDIARQLIEFPYGDGPEVALGGGRQNFLPTTLADPEHPEETGKRDDGRDLTAEWTAKYNNAGYVWNEKQFNAIQPATTDHLLGLFERGHMQFSANREQDVGGEPTLSAMTEKALHVLQKKDKGYFLMVEAGRIDHGHHATNAYHALHDGVALNKAVQKAMDMTREEDTLILVTADHSHTLVIAGYPTRGNPILGTIRTNDTQGNPMTEAFKAADGKAITTLGYYVGPNSPHEDGSRDDPAAVDTTAPDYKQQTAVPAPKGHHAGEDVAIYARGPGADQIKGVMEQNKIYNVIENVLKLK